MSVEIFHLTIILLAAIILFATGVIRMDLTALFVLVALAVTGLVNTTQALSGFSNPAVVIVWAMFILSAGLSRTGISGFIGAALLKNAGKSEGRLIAILMLVTALLSSIMNNIGVAAMFLPITLEIARRTKRRPSRLLLPMAYGALHGGLILLIGTASNLVVRDAMSEAQIAPLGIFDFAPGGLIILMISMGYMVWIGRHFLPKREPQRALFVNEYTLGETAQEQYGLQERLATVIVPEGNPLVGKTLSQSRIGSALGLNVLSIRRRNGQRIRAKTETVLEGGDRLLVIGRLDQIDEICMNPLFRVENSRPVVENLLTGNVGLAELSITSDSPFVGKLLSEIDLRHRYFVTVLGIQQGEIVRRTNLQSLVLNPGDRLLIYGLVENIEVFKPQCRYRRLKLKDSSKYLLDERLLSLRISENSSLIGKTLAESRLGAAYGLSVLRILRNGDDWHLPNPEMQLQADDVLIVEGRPLDIDVLRGLQYLELDCKADVDLDELNSGPIQMVEVMLSPYSSLAGKNMRNTRFRQKYQVSVLAIWRGDRAFRSGIGDLTLQHGDALLCYGTAENLKAMGSERDFVVLKMDLQEAPRIKKAPIAAMIMAGVVLTAIGSEIPISIAAIGGCALMVLSGVLTMGEAYESIDWRSIFLIAAMLPMGIAIQETGAAAYVSGFVIENVGIYGPTAILAGLMVLCTAGTLIMPSPVLAVIMSPIALNAAFDLGISPYAFLLGVAYALAASFISPVAIPVNTLVMTPGGYRYSDYIKHGLPVSIIVIIVSVLLLPLLFPF
jgi:di/tricarboxylate transporter